MLNQTGDHLSSVWAAKVTEPPRADRPRQFVNTAARKILVELVGYGVVSVVALAADVATLRALVEWADWHYLPASALAFVLGAGVAYVLSVRFVFRFRLVGNRALELSYFVILGGVGLLVNAAVLSTAIDVVGIALIPAKLLAAVCTFATNFMLRRRLLFSPATSAGR